MLRLESIDHAIILLRIIDADILNYTNIIKTGCSTKNIGSLRIKAMQCREILHKRLEETYTENISMDKVLKDLQRQ